MTEQAAHNLVSLAGRFSKGADGPNRLLADCLALIDATNRNVNAVTILDRAGAERAAAQSARRWRKGAPLSPIDGAPIMVKANIAVAGLPWHAGIAAYANRIAAADAPCVARLRDTGAVILGLANMDEGALGARGDNAWLGRVVNPCHAAMSAGGSSGGSAAAVAAGYCMAALGSDTIGSVMIPASYCGITGHRASHAAMSVEGIVPLSPALDHGGWLTRSVADAIVLYRAIGGSIGRLARPRVALLSLDDLDIGREVRDAGAGTVARLRSIGCEVGTVRPPLPLGPLGKLLFEIAETEGARVHATTLGARPDGFSPGLRRMLAWGSDKGVAVYQSHLAERARVAAAWRTALSGCDALLLPTTSYPAYDAGGPAPADQALFTALPACLDWPATAIPAGTTADGLPLSLMVIGPDDERCLTVAALIEPA